MFLNALLRSLGPQSIRSDADISAPAFSAIAVHRLMAKCFDRQTCFTTQVVELNKA